MPLHGYLGKTNPGRISSINTIEGDPSRRKKIKLSNDQSSEAQLIMYVQDCISHEPIGVVVSVDLYRLTAGGSWEELGTAKCCPLCWLIIVPPDGVELPAPGKYVLPKKRKVSPKQRVVLKEERHRSKSGKNRHSPLWKMIEGYADAMEPFTVQELMDESGLSRTAVRKVIVKLVHEGQLEISASSEGGRGNRTEYIGKAP